MPRYATEATEATEPKPALPVPPKVMAELASLPLGSFLPRAAGLAASLLEFDLGDAEKVREAEVKLEAMGQALKRLGQSEETARRAYLLACAFARAIGQELGPGKRGRPSADSDLPLPGLEDKKARARYRLCAELSEEAFARWAAETETPSVGALAAAGQRARAEDSGREARDRAESPAAAPTPPRPALQGPAEAPEARQVDPDTGEELEVDPPAPPAPSSHHREAWRAACAREAEDALAFAEVADEIAAKSEELRPQAEELARSARSWSDQLRSTLPQTT